MMFSFLLKRIDPPVCQSIRSCLLLPKYYFIVPTAEILFKYAHHGSTFAMMLRCGRGVCGTSRVDVNRAMCPSAQGSAWTMVVIWGELTLFIAIAINMNSGQSYEKSL
jgi:hypothetical protein